MKPAPLIPQTLTPTVRRPLRVIQYGLGAIGQATARLILQKSSVQLVGAIDVDPAKVGRDLGAVLGVDKHFGVLVSNKPADVFLRPRADVVIHTTGSRVPDVFPQLMQIVEAGLHCVTSAEEMSFPFARHGALAEKLDAAARQRDVTVLGAGVNPGFVMDALPVLLTAASQRVDEVRVTRVVDVGTRRPQLQKKVGVGLTVAECNAMIAAGKFGHVGLSESTALIAHAMGWRHANLQEETNLLLEEIADKKSKTKIEPRVTGMAQTATAKMLDRVRVTLNLEMSVGAQNPRDEIEILGIPPIRVVISNGIAGDLATPAILVNTAPYLLNAARGLLTVLDIQSPRLAP